MFTPTARTVAIIQREIPHYRIRFFEELYAQGRSAGYEILVYATSHPIQNGTAPAFPYRILPLRLFGNGKSSAYWMNGLEAEIAGTDVVVAPQELQCLTVPYLWAKRKRVCKTWIWWGHGYNHQASVNPSLATDAKEQFKRFLTKRADGLITYTEGGANYWRQQGLDEHRVTPYLNTIDVEGLRKAGAEVTARQLVKLRQKLGLEDKRVLLFSGRLYPEKRVDFLLRAFALLKHTHKDVALLIIGDGGERNKLEYLAEKLGIQDVHFLGECVAAKDSAPYFNIAELMVIPGLVGLAIVHGFAYGLPLFTTRHDFHSPEIEYLTERNGVMTSDDESSYARAIRTALITDSHLMALRKEANRAADGLLLVLAVERFINGITKVIQC